MAVDVTSDLICDELAGGPFKPSVGLSGAVDVSRDREVCLRRTTPHNEQRVVWATRGNVKTFR